MAAAAAGAYPELPSKPLQVSGKRTRSTRSKESDKKVKLSYKETYSTWISKFGNLVRIARGHSSVFAIDANRVLKVTTYAAKGKPISRTRSMEEMALREINTIQRLNAASVPHMVTYLDHCVDQGVEAAVVLGRDDQVLSQFACGFKSLRPLMRRHMEALAKMHSLGYGHFDLKPDNLTLTRVLDFGSALTVEPGKLLNRVGTTLCYRSPEMFLGQGYSFPADVWSYGCCLFEFFTGTSLFNLAGNVENLISQIDYFHLLIRYFGVTHDMVKPNKFRSRYLTIDMETGELGVKSASGRLNSERRSFSGRIRDSDLAKKESPEEVELFVDLIGKMLQLDPDGRASFRELLAHPFLAKDAEKRFRLDLEKLEIERGRVVFLFEGKEVESCDLQSARVCVHVPSKSFPLDIQVFDEKNNLVLTGMIIELEEGLEVKVKSYESPEVLATLDDSSSGLSSSDDEEIL